MKRHELYFGIIKLPVEFLIVYLSFYLARDIRGVTDLIPGVHLPLKNFTDYDLNGFAFFGAILFTLVFIFMGLYKILPTYSRVKQFSDMLKSGLVWFMIYIGSLYLALGFVYTVEIPRLIILFALLISIFSIFVERSIIDYVQRFLLEKGSLSKSKIGLVMKENHPEIVNAIRNSGLYEIAGYFNTGRINDLEYQFIGDHKAIHDSKKLRQMDEILFVSSNFEKGQVDELFEYARIYGIKYKYVANSFDFTKNNTETSFIHKLPVVEIRSIGLSPWGRVIKRIMDLIGSFFGILILLPLFFLVVVLIKLEDPAGPAIFKNKRVGKGGRLFDLYKFRYMKWEYCVKDAYGVKPHEDKALEYEKKLIEEKSERDGPLYKIINDPRKTKIGTFIEKYSIDELPQLFNVLLGQMSLVGPRPHQVREVDLYKDYQKRVLTLKPGMTGMAQTNGRHKNGFDDEVRLDIFYIENWSLLLDIKILFRTVMVVLKKD